MVLAYVFIFFPCISYYHIFGVMELIRGHSELVEINQFMDLFLKLYLLP